MNVLSGTLSEPGQDVVALRVAAAYDSSFPKHLHGSTWHGDLFEDGDGSLVSHLVVDTGTDVESVILHFLTASNTDDIMALVDSRFVQHFKVFGFGTADVFRCVGGELVHIMRTGVEESATAITYCLGCSRIWPSASPDVVDCCVSCDMEQMFTAMALA